MASPLLLLFLLSWEKSAWGVKMAASFCSSALFASACPSMRHAELHECLAPPDSIMLILGIETSCDDTAAAVMQDDSLLLASVLSSQDQIHTRFGGVVPELASRKHLESIVPIVQEALERADVTLADIHLIAVTQGPGLIGSLLVGFSYAKALSYVAGIPFVGVDHMAGHLLAAFLEEEKPDFPYIALIVSGGTSSIYLAHSHTSFTLLGRTRDDAAGEAFDKVAKILGMPYPGGPHVSAEAGTGDRSAIAFPRAWLGRSLSIPGANGTGPSLAGGRSLSTPGANGTGPSLAGGRSLSSPGANGAKPSMAVGHSLSITGSRTIEPSPADEEGSLDFSFSGLKTAVLNHCNGERQKSVPLQLADVCASFQEAIVDVLVAKTLLAARKYSVGTIVLGGGVSANPRLREVMGEYCRQEGINLCIPRPSFCTDNAAMIALAGFYYFKKSGPGQYDQDVYSRSQLQEK